VEGIGDGLKFPLVARAVTGGRFSVIVNVPNPAGVEILQMARVFRESGISPLGLFLGAKGPTCVAAFWW